MKKIIFMMGSPASGKSRAAKREYPGVEVLDSDSIKAEHPDYNPKAPELLHRWSSEEMEKRFMIMVVNNDSDFIVDGTGGNTDKMFRRMSMAKANNWEVVLVYVTAPLNVCLERNQKRARTVPDSIVKQKYDDAKYGFELVAPHADKVKIISNM